MTDARGAQPQPVWRVYKFGGTSLGSLGRLPQVLRLVEEAPADGTRLALVVSALGDSTDHLEASAEAAALGNSAAGRDEIQKVSALARTTAGQVLSGTQLEDFCREADRILAAADPILGEISRELRCTPGQLDAVLALGEPVAAALVAAALRARSVPARAQDARQFLVTDAQAGAARVDWAETSRRFGGVAAGWEGILPVITGFVAATREGKTTTLGRNGSDYTATLLAALLGAGEVTVWTDVPGVMTADPAIVAEAVPVDRLSYDEALELAYFGTRMFHPRTIIPLRECGAALVIRSTSNPGAPGTRIDALGNPDPDRPTCVTSLENLSLLGVGSRRAEIGRPVGSRIVDGLVAAGVRVWLATESTLGQTFSVVVPCSDEAAARRLIAETLEREPAAGELTQGEPISPVSLVTLVAEAMGHRPNVAGRFLGAIGRAGVTVRAIAQGASQRNVSCVVDAADTAAAVRTVHAAFNLAHAEISVLLLGKGVVGRSLLDQLERHRVDLRTHHDTEVKLVGLADSSGAVFAARGLEPAEAKRLLGGGGKGGRTRRAPEALLPELARLPNPVLVDCTAADGMEELYAEAFARGVNVVSANKKPLAIPLSRYDALKAAARRHYRAFHYETTVGAALPVIETLKNLVRTGDHVVRIEGAFSGTLGFLSERLSAGERLSSAVRKARDLGYTEPNPRDDLSGLDVARKALILARELGLRLDLADVKLEPFVPAEGLAQGGPEAFLSSLEGLDQAFAERMEGLRHRGMLLRYLARIDLPKSGPRVAVSPVEIGPDHPAWSLHGTESFVAFHTERYHEHPLIVRGAGAGGEITASGVLADILRLAQNIRGRP